jgi:hypothetical protein
VDVEALEPELEALLRRAVPDDARAFEGASADEVRRLEEIAGEPLPPCYLWFLRRMGRDMDGLAHRWVDFCAPAVLAAHDDDPHLPAPRRLRIAVRVDDIVPASVDYHLDEPARDDARVLGALHDFETLRELLAWRALWWRYAAPSVPRCFGWFTHQDPAALTLLASVMPRLGFTAPVATGTRCALYEADDAVLLAAARPAREPGVHHFHLAGPDARRREVLAAIADATPLVVGRVLRDPP